MNTPPRDPMAIRHYTVRFLTPAFLGNAEQSGQWRTPPFKHLLREWWRVAWVAAGGDPADIPALRREEARLFGTAADGQGNRSRVRMRLEHWDTGRMKQWQGGGKVRHPEVGRNGTAVGADLYLGYGPLAYDKDRKSTKLKANAAIRAGETNALQLAFPRQDARVVDHALALMSAFGTLGGRSRNGWGSIVLEGEIEEPRLPLRNWQKCLDLEWAHAIGQDDDRPLVWHTGEFGDWKDLMKELARIKIDLRTQFQFHNGKDAPAPEDRHWLSYPVTNHSVKNWGNQRLPNSLRFRIRSDERGRFYGVIFHMPCRPPAAFRPSTDTLIHVWGQVHAFLDGQKILHRMSA